MSKDPMPVVPDTDRAVMESWLRSPTAPAGLVKRARVVLLAADGAGTGEIVERTGATTPTVIGWRNRYLIEGLSGLDDRDKPGRPAQIDELDIVNATLAAPPPKLGITHWSSRILGKQLGISNVTVAQDLETVGSEAVEAGDLQVLHRPRAGSQSPGRGRLRGCQVVKAISAN